MTENKAVEEEQKEQRLIAEVRQELQSAFKEHGSGIMSHHVSLGLSPWMEEVPVAVVECEKGSPVHVAVEQIAQNHDVSMREEDDAFLLYIQISDEKKAELQSQMDEFFDEL